MTAGDVVIYATVRSRTSCASRSLVVDGWYNLAGPCNTFVLSYGMNAPLVGE